MPIANWMITASIVFLERNLTSSIKEIGDPFKTELAVFA
jgi:hypothetical protein